MASHRGYWLDRLNKIRYFCVIMMKKLLTVALTAISLISLQGQDLLFGKGKEHEFTITPVGPDDCPIYMTNNTGKPMVIAYEKVSADYNPGWIVSFCDNANCYSDFIASDTFTTVAANETVNIKISIMSMAKADTAVIKYAVWNKNASSIVKDTLTWTIYMPQSASVNPTLLESALVYPNPSSDFIVLPVGAKDVELVDNLGRRIEHVRITSNRLDLTSYPSGKYTLRFSNNGVVSSQSILRK